jgi:uncharacterized protein YyaL (SSP411 family)
MPHGHASLLVALEESLFPFQSVIIRGTSPTMAAWHTTAAQPYAPRRLTLAIPADATGLPDQLEARSPAADPVAYVCSGLNCSAPVTDLDAFEALLSETATPRIS